MKTFFCGVTFYSSKTIVDKTINADNSVAICATETKFGTSKSTPLIRIPVLHKWFRLKNSFEGGDFYDF